MRSLLVQISVILLLWMIRKKAADLSDYTGLGLVDFYVVPHYQSREFKDSSEQIVQENQAQKKIAIIYDHQAIWVRDEAVEILGKR